jgi:hypothetical protein
MANDEVDALSALEKEAKEYDKVRDQLKILVLKMFWALTPVRRMQKLIASSRLSGLMRKPAGPSLWEPDH